MGERERRVTDRRAVLGGVRVGVVAAAVSFGVLYALRFFVNPVVRDLSGGLSLPDGGSLGVVASGLGVLVGWAGVRSRGRYVARGAVSDSDRDRYGAALAIARADYRGGGDRRSTRRTEVAGPVRLWSHDLLAGSAGDEAPRREGLT